MKLRLLIVFSLLFLSCNSDDDRVIEDEAVEGEWVLSNVVCYCGFEPDIDFSLTKIDFNTERSMVTVTHESEYAFFRENGEHFYGGQANRINFSDGNVFRFEVKGSQLTLTYEDSPEISDDEVTFIFVR
ncbi:hypothetical protein [Maribacter stanieri]|uniref:Lipocalin-like domain-containing protein n=1 Tax=Maribacter stanieri TaxID=440514 RepID=A0A1I6HGF6_9FLAO|nr:hypothetical protein [Maribacter stanieri]SFR53511.1 hypothetical protein SAMN04488010_0348 [Maribacter stanieri]